MIIFSSDIVLTDEPLGTPVFLWQSLLTLSNVAATTEDPSYPATNLVNPATWNFWRALDASPLGTEYLTFTVAADEPFDAVGLAGHNLGSSGATVSLEALNTDVSPPAWEEIVETFQPADDTPILMRFNPTAYSAVRVPLVPGTAAPQVAVAMAGKLLVAPRSTSANHVPINLGRKVTTVPGRSQSGNYLGQIITQESVSSQFSFSMFEEDWYRAVFDPFLAAVKGETFFFGWSPRDRPFDIGYCWLTNDPMPGIHWETGRIASIDLQLAGIAA